MGAESYLPGATTIGLKCKDGVILASEKRVSYGFTLVSKAGKKVFKINNRLGLACAGMIADMQAITRALAAEVNLYELENERIMPIKSAAKLLSVILFNRRYMPYLTETLIGGIDAEGPHLFVLDPIGSLIEDDYAVLGTGAKIAIGIIETEYQRGLAVKEGRELAIKAIKAAISRDAVSGDGIDILRITNEGATEESIPLISPI